MHRLTCWVIHLTVWFTAAALIATTLGISFLNSGNWPTGGDTASHLLYAWLYANDFFWTGEFLPWVPEVFGGFPFLSYYFPLPFIVISVLAKVIGFSPAFKWGAFLAAMALPGTVFSTSRCWLKFSWQASLFAALGAFGFLMHEQHSIWGGNLLSCLSGEFAYSYGLLFATAAMMAWCRAILQGKGWLTAALLEAASGFSHGFPLLVLGFSTAFFLIDSGTGWDRHRAKRTFVLLLKGHLLAFCLLGGWLWPMIEMHPMTIPNDAAFPLSNWQDLLPPTLWPFLAMGVLGLAALSVPRIRNELHTNQALPIRHLASSAGLAAVAFILGDRLGLASIRFFPLVWLLGVIVCGWLFGQVISLIQLPKFSSICITLGLFFALLGWTASQIRAAPDWALWNHSGLNVKPQWAVLSTLFPAMKGDLWSPRLLFEHDPANNDLGSTRTLEALPMFLNHRPVLEGLYMESATLGPAVYQLQSEVSAQPSSPLSRFPAGSLNPESAARNMNALHADTLLLRSEKAKAAIESSGLFLSLATAPPFSLYRLKHFDSELVSVVTKPLEWLPTKNWMMHSFQWFRSPSDFLNSQPVYGNPPEDLKEISLPGVKPSITTEHLSRHEMLFTTSAPHEPHLIKITYHPRWQLRSKGKLYMAAPGFIVVIPEENVIHLAYGHTLIGTLGMAATSISLLVLAWFISRRRTSGMSSDLAGKTHAHRWLPLLFAWLMLITCSYYFSLNPPARPHTEPVGDYAPRLIP